MNKQTLFFSLIFICYFGTIIYLLNNNKYYRSQLDKKTAEVNEKDNLIHRYENTVDAFDEVTDVKCRATIDSIFGKYFYNDLN